LILNVDEFLLRLFQELEIRLHPQSDLRNLKMACKIKGHAGQQILQFDLKVLAAAKTHHDGKASSLELAKTFSAASRKST
jgi:hypothetical protein